MTDGAVDVRLDFVFIKAHMRGDTGRSGWGGLSSLSRFTHSVLLFCLASDVSTLTLIFHQSTPPCDLWGQIVTEVTVTFLSSVWDLHHRTLVLHRREGFESTTDSSLWCCASCKKQSGAQAASRPISGLNSMTAPLCCVRLWPGLNQSQPSGAETHSFLPYLLSLTPYLARFFCSYFIYS